MDVLAKLRDRDADEPELQLLRRFRRRRADEAQVLVEDVAEGGTRLPQSQLACCTSAMPRMMARACSEIRHSPPTFDP
ncbi:hypothetical protein BWR60_01850 [Inquilinus limosus]|uniref:Uncharacterized protein n=1 Tax=Inquilinus limosus TaxID=171674 RepID=A0A211ZUA2_9PROT|nr:hypothetical protein BWR60_01850 [Inquilinus limosus]